MGALGRRRMVWHTSMHCQLLTAWYGIMEREGAEEMAVNMNWQQLMAMADGNRLLTISSAFASI